MIKTIQIQEKLIITNHHEPAGKTWEICYEENT